MDKIKSQLEDEGFAVVDNVLSSDQCDQYINDIHIWLNKFGSDFPKNIESLIHSYNISHIAPAWETRIQAKSVFEEIWETKKLHSSLDGIAIGRPPELGETYFNNHLTGANQLHIDQGPDKKGLHTYQGAVYLEEALEDDWTFMVLEKSKHFHNQFFDSGPDFPLQLRVLTEAQIQWYKDKGCQLKRLNIPKGGMVLWDSRTIHAGAPPVKGRKNPGRWRYVIFVSMTPAIWSGPKDLERKKECYQNMRISKHWSSQGFDMFNYGKTPLDITIMPDIGKTEKARLLAGDLEYSFADGESNGPGWKPKMAL